jgi:hypothetical protein
MPDISLDGVIYRIVYRSKKAVVFIDEKDHRKLLEWWRDNHIDTVLAQLRHPILDVPCFQISAETTANNIEDGTLVKITIEASSRMRGKRPHIGIKTISIKPR